MKPRYRRKGKWPNGETKVVIEYDSPNVQGKIKTFTLPKAGTLLNVFLFKEKLSKKQDVKTRSLSDPKVHRNKK